MGARPELQREGQDTFGSERERKREILFLNWADGGQGMVSIPGDFDLPDFDLPLAN